MAGIIYKMHTRGRVATVAISVVFSLLFLRPTFSWVLMLELNVSLLWLRLFAVLTFRSAAMFYCCVCCEFANMCFKFEQRATEWRLKMDVINRNENENHFFFCINKHFSKRWARTDNYEVTTNSWMMSPQRKYRYYVEREPHREYFDTTTNFDTNMCVCDCWPYKGIAYNSHCHMHGERAQPKEWHSIPAYDLFFRSLRSCRWFCVIMDSCRRWHAKR